LPDPPPGLTAGEAIRPKNPLKNGMTIFPGGEPLYINNVLVGAIGVSGDGVDQDDIISYAGTAGFRPTLEIRSDQLGSSQIVSFIASRIQTLEQTYSLGTLFSSSQGFDLADLLELAQNRLASGLAQFRLPYVKFPRNPEI
jgi:Haem-degrading